jgi:hypothetical protein
MTRAFVLSIAIGAGCLALGSSTFAQQPAGRGRGAEPAAVRPASMFKEEWKQPPYTGTLNDENRRATQEAVANPRLELKLYGTAAKDVGVYAHEGRMDLWNGVVKSPMAIMLRDRTSYADLSGLARLRAIVRTMGLHVIYPVVKLADGSYAAGSRGANTDGDFLEVEIAFGGMRWHKFDPAACTTSAEVKNPDLTKVDEIGFVDLAPGGGHGVSGAFNLSTIELFAKPVPR